MGAKIITKSRGRVTRPIKPNFMFTDIIFSVYIYINFWSLLGHRRDKKVSGQQCLKTRTPKIGMSRNDIRAINF